MGGEGLPDRGGVDAWDAKRRPEEVGRNRFYKQKRDNRSAQEGNGERKHFVERKNGRTRAGTETMVSKGAQNYSDDSHEVNRSDRLETADIRGIRSIKPPALALTPPLLRNHFARRRRRRENFGGYELVEH